MHVVSEITQFYQWDAKFTFEPLYFEPYNQNIRWSRFEANNGLHMWVSGDRMGRALRFATHTTENMQTFERSIVEFVLDDNDDYELIPMIDDETVFMFDPDYEVEQDDPHWHKSFEPSSLTTLLNKNWYSEVKLF